MSTKARAMRQRASGFDWILKGLEAGLLFVLPLVFYRGFAEQFSTGKTLLAQALVALGLAAWSAALLSGKIRWPSSFRMALPLGALAAAVLISCHASSVPIFSLIEAGYFLCGPLWLMIWVMWSSGEADVRRAATFVSAASGVASGVAMLQWAGHDPLLFGGYGVSWGTMVPRMRLYSTFGNPNLLCGYLIGAVFPALALALMVRSQAWKIAAWASVSMMLIAIAGTGSYGGWVALIAGAMAAGLVYRAAHGGPRAGAAELPKTGMKSAIPVWLVAALVLQVSVDPSLLSRAQGRLFLWRAAWPMFREHPLIGSGWGTFQLRFLELQAQFLAAHPQWTRFWTMALEAHNDPYQILLEAGLLGFAALVWLIVEYSREVRTAARSTSSRESALWLAASAGGVTAILTNSLVNFQLAVAPTLILLSTLLGIPQKLAPPAESTPLRAVNRRVALPATLILTAMCGFLFWGVASRAVGEMKYQAALEFESQGDLAAAEHSDRAGIAAAPWNGRLRFALARVLYLQQKYPDALAEARLAERAFSDSHLEVLKARILDRMGRGPEALVSYRRARFLDTTLVTVQADIERLEKIPAN